MEHLVPHWCGQAGLWAGLGLTMDQKLLSMGTGTLSIKLLTAYSQAAASQQQPLTSNVVNA